MAGMITHNRIVLLALLLAVAPGAAFSAPPKPPDFGPKVLLFNPSTPAEAIQQQIDKVYAIQQHSEFGRVARENEEEGRTESFPHTPSPPSALSERRAERRRFSRIVPRAATIHVGFSAKKVRTLFRNRHTIKSAFADFIVCARQDLNLGPASISGVLYQLSYARSGLTIAK